jgi:hypothetical protein
MIFDFCTYGIIVGYPADLRQEGVYVDFLFSLSAWRILWAVARPTRRSWPLISKHLHLACAERVVREARCADGVWAPVQGMERYTMKERKHKCIP